MLTCLSSARLEHRSDCFCKGQRASCQVLQTRPVPATPNAVFASGTLSIQCLKCLGLVQEPDAVAQLNRDVPRGEGRPSFASTCSGLRETVVTTCLTPLAWGSCQAPWQDRPSRGARVCLRAPERQRVRGHETDNKADLSSPPTNPLLRHSVPRPRALATTLPSALPLTLGRGICHRSFSALSPPCHTGRATRRGTTFVMRVTTAQSGIFLGEPLLSYRSGAFTPSRGRLPASSIFVTITPSPDRVIDVDARLINALCRQRWREEAPNSLSRPGCPGNAHR